MGGFGCLVVITLIFRYKQLRRTTTTRLVFFQTCSYFVEALFSVGLPSDLPAACRVQSVVVQYSMQCSALWGCVMIYVLYSILERKVTARLAYNPNREMIAFHLICWLLPLPLAIAPLLTGPHCRYCARIHRLSAVFLQAISGRSPTPTRGAGFKTKKGSVFCCALCTTASIGCWPCI